MGSDLVPRIRDRFDAAQNILILSHLRPDGDAVGSVLGLGLALKNLGKSVQMVLEHGVPTRFRYLPGAEEISKSVLDGVDLAVVLDSSDAARVGAALETYGQADINIDHHISNTRFARINLVWPDEASVTQILAEILPQMGLPLTRPICMALLTGLITDTIGFRTPSTTPKTLKLAARMMEQGIDLAQIYRLALINKSYAALHYWGAGLSRVERDQGLVWTVLELADRHSSGYPGRDDADLINELAAVEDCEVAVILIEQPDNKVKISWRARPGFDTAQVARCFGGGGHQPASGAMVDGRLSDVKESVLQVTREVLWRP